MNNKNDNHLLRKINEGMKNPNKGNMNKAKINKNDEFCTMLTDIEKEGMKYKEQFRDKVIYCNCDDPTWSNFYKFFSLNFNFFGLKKLITTHYEMDGKQSYKLELTKYGEQPKKTLLEGNGDFRSKECIELLKESDIVITNPPFSLFREYVGQLIEYNKKFLILGSANAITYKDLFSFIKDNKIKIGYKSFSGGMVFETEKKETKTIPVLWYTNLELTKHKEIIEEGDLFRNYNKDDYPKYDNYDAINVNKVKEIPKDYYGVMGVPITYITKHNDKLFKMVVLTTPKLNYKTLYKRVFIQRKESK